MKKVPFGLISFPSFSSLSSLSSPSITTEIVTASIRITRPTAVDRARTETCLEPEGVAVSTNGVSKDVHRGYVRRHAQWEGADPSFLLESKPRYTVQYPNPEIRNGRTPSSRDI